MWESDSFIHEQFALQDFFPSIVASNFAACIVVISPYAVTQDTV